ncbi:DUF4336 domain-containing protein [Marinimicrobium locisalis]|uniref:DUF4336 domain-containing protein n=1 Tax=Marinimicrobium locisalis TaxID=546022 RepID=UPI003221F0A9
MDVYEPLQILKPVSNNIWIADGPLIDFKGVEFPTRMTIIRLSSGGLFVHSPVALTDTLKQQVDGLGPVEHLVSPNRIHYWWIGDWGKAYPNALKWASPGAHRAVKALEWSFDKDLSDCPEKAWRDDIDQLVVKGSRVLEEVVFFHKKSRTLILADLIENFEPRYVHSGVLRALMKLGGVLHPDGKLPIDLRLSYVGRHHCLRKALDSILAWNPEKVIIAHGRWYESNGTAELRRAFRWVKPSH